MLVWLGWTRVRVKIGWVALFQRVSHLGDGLVMVCHHVGFGHVIRSSAGGQCICASMRYHARTPHKGRLLYGSHRGRSCGDGTGPARSIIGTQRLYGSYNAHLVQGPSQRQQCQRAPDRVSGTGPTGREARSVLTQYHKHVYRSIGVGLWHYKWLYVNLFLMFQKVPDAWEHYQGTVFVG